MNLIFTIQPRGCYVEAARCEVRLHGLWLDESIPLKASFSAGVKKNDSLPIQLIVVIAAIVATWLDRAKPFKNILNIKRFKVNS